MIDEGIEKAAPFGHARFLRHHNGGWMQNDLFVIEMHEAVATLVVEGCVHGEHSGVRSCMSCWQGQVYSLSNQAQWILNDSISIWP